MLDSKWARVLLSWDTGIGVGAGAAVWLLSNAPAQGLALGLLGGAVALVAVLATIITLLAVLLHADVMGPLVNRLGGRDDVMFPFWFHGYLAAATIGLAIMATATAGAVARAFTAAAAGALVWSGIAMIDLAREAMRLGRFRNELENAATRYRNRPA